MQLEPREIIKTCSTHYQIWKDEAIKSRNPGDTKRFLEKAFFWLELQSNLLILWTVEKTMGNDPIIREKVEKAQININEKIIDYANSILKDLK